MKKLVYLCLLSSFLLTACGVSKDVLTPPTLNPDEAQESVVEDVQTEEVKEEAGEVSETEKNSEGNDITNNAETNSKEDFSEEATYAAGCYDITGRMLFELTPEMVEADYDSNLLDTLSPGDAAVATLVVIPEKTTKIGANAFCDMQDAEFILPDSIEEIGESAFEGCFEKYPRLVMPASLKKIEDRAFAYSGLSQIILNEGLEEIGESAFESSMLSQELIIPESVLSIGKDAFADTDSLIILYNGIAEGFPWGAVSQ